MESLLYFLGVALVVEFQQALQDFTTGGFADGEADALLGVVEAVTEFEVIPAVSGGNRLIHLDVQITELLNVGGHFVGVMEAVVGLGQPFLPCNHEQRPFAIVRLSNLLQM